MLVSERCRQLMSEMMGLAWVTGIYPEGPRKITYITTRSAWLTNMYLKLLSPPPTTKTWHFLQIFEFLNKSWQLHKHISIDKEFFQA